MLLAIRDRAKGWFAWFIILALAVPFALSALYNYIQGPSDSVAAEVNGTEIHTSLVTQRFNQQRQQLQAMLGDRYDPAMINEAQLRRDVLEQLIDQMLLADYVRGSGFRVTDAEIARSIRGNPAFHEDGRFSRELYMRLLRANGLTHESYVQNVRQGQMLGHLESGIGGSELVTDADLQRLIELERQQRSFDYLTVSVGAFLNPAAVEPSEIQEYYASHPELFQRPERVRLQYVELSDEVMRQQVEVDPAELRRRYEEQRDTRFTDHGEREVAHILLSLPEGAGEAEVAQAREQLQQLRQRVLQGESFADLAREHSDDPGSASTGGNLGQIQPGMMVEPFEEVAFALEEGEISEPVRTQFGLHLIQAVRVEPGQVQPYEQVKDQIKAEVVADRANRKLYELSQQLGNIAYESPESLEPVANEMGLEIKTTDWVTANGAESGLAANPQVVEAAFSQEVLGNGHNSDVIELDGRHVVLRVAEHDPARRLPLEEVADDVRNRVAREQARRQAGELADELTEALRNGAEPGELAQREGVDLHSAELVSRDAQEHPREVLQLAFALPRPEQGEAQVGDTATRNEQFAIVRLKAVRDGDLADLSDEEKQQYRSSLQSIYGNSSLTGFIESLRSDAKVEVYESRL